MTIFTGVLLFLFIVSVYKVPTPKSSQGFGDRFNAILDATANLILDVSKYYISALHTEINNLWKWIKNSGPYVRDKTALILDMSKHYIFLTNLFLKDVFSIVGSVIYEGIVIISNAILNILSIFHKLTDYAWKWLRNVNQTEQLTHTENSTERGGYPCSKDDDCNSQKGRGYCNLKKLHPSSKQGGRMGTCDCFHGFGGANCSIVLLPYWENKH